MISWLLSTFLLALRNSILEAYKINDYDTASKRSAKRGIHFVTDSNEEMYKPNNRHLTII